MNNFRDLGGYPYQIEMLVTRWGRIFRIQTARITSQPADLEVFDALEVRVIYDLRRDAERDADPGTASLWGPLRTAKWARICYQGMENFEV